MSRPAMSASSRPGGPHRVGRWCCDWPRCSMFHCANRTSCCWPPDLPRCTASGLSTIRIWQPSEKASSGFWARTTRPRALWSTGRGRSCRPTPAPTLLMDGVAPSLLERPNALRMALHPQGMAPRIRNLPQWRHHLIERLRREVAVSGSTELLALLTEIESYPGGFEGDPRPRRRRGSVGAVHLAGKAADVLEHGDDLRHGDGPHCRRTEHRGVSARRRGHSRRAALKRP